MAFVSTREEEHSIACKSDTSKFDRNAQRMLTMAIKSFNERLKNEISGEERNNTPAKLFSLPKQLISRFTTQCKMLNESFTIW